MKNRLKELLESGKPAIGTLVQVPSAPVVEILAQAGFDWLMIDAEHGPIDVETLHAMIRATSGTNATPTVRVARNLDWLAKRVLDLGALGVMMPGVNSPEEALTAVRAVRYPPEGNRGFGPTFAALRWGFTGPDYAQQANREVMAMVQIEHIDAVERIEEILAVPGIEPHSSGRMTCPDRWACWAKWRIPGFRKRSIASWQRPRKQRSRWESSVLPRTNQSIH